ncbi:uncharacterized protein PRCAT00002178001 [Priceomyces carsonii]|uniref:uncharacterized protein n=1 Tax=Priceomyces carsonii TaxID=28549 RepID=UPI002ED98181|nr:unnamed protein product [Priceomyces carsonii]
MIFKSLRFWFITSVIVLLVLPFLRASQRQDEVQKLVELKHFINSSLEITLPIYVRFGDYGFQFPDLVTATQIQVDTELPKVSKKNLKVKLVDNLELGQINRSQPYESTYDEQYKVDLFFSTDNTVGMDSTDMTAFVFYNLDAIRSNDLPFFLTQTVIYHLLDFELSMSPKVDHFNYFPTPTLNFILVDNDSETDVVKLKGIIEGLLFDFRKHLNSYMNFTIQTSKIEPEKLLEVEEQPNAYSESIAKFVISHESNQKVVTERFDDDFFTFFYNNDTSSKFVDQDRNISYSLQALIEESLGFPDVKKSVTLKQLVMKRHRTIEGLNAIIDNFIICFNERNEKNVRLFDGKLKDHLENLSTLLIDLKEDAKPNWGDYLLRVYKLNEDIKQIRYQLDVL